MTIIYSNQCLNCEKPVATGPGRTGKFCSRSCSAKHNNKSRKPREYKNSCKKCQIKMPSGRSYCEECSPHNRNNVTLGELRNKAVRRSQVYNTLRQASKTLSLDMPQHCVVCGYSNHVEVSHLRPLADLPDSTTVAEAVGKHNFVLLCPNHHWELDYGDLGL